MRVAIALGILALFVFAGCAVPSPATRATDAARELNLAARFGRMDLAVGRTSDHARQAFIRRRAGWGREVRVVDVELTAFSMADKDDASVEVDYAWVRMDEGTLRVTRVGQKWADRGKGWQLVSEQRLSGDAGLFGEAPVKPVERHPDAHFATKVIRDDG